MTQALMGSIPTLVWAIILFVSVLAFFALVMFHVLAEYYFRDQGQPFEPRQELWMYFGTFPRALFTMFELTFANWPPVARLLVEHVHECFIPLVMIYRLVLGFAVVGVVNSVFIQETFKIAALDDHIMTRQRRRMTKAHELKMEKLFRSADVSHSGKISVKELGDLFRDEHLQDW